MANPNKTVGIWRRKIGFPERERREPMEFAAWLIAQAEAGVRFQTMAEAEAAFAARPAEDDVERDRRAGKRG